MSGIGGFLTKMGILEAETSVPTPAAVPVQPVVTGASYQVMSTSNAVNPELMVALITNINGNVSPNNLQAVLDMAETLKSAIVDEGTRIKAAAAALKLSFSDISTSIDSLVYQTGCEKEKFISNDITSMDKAIGNSTDALNGVIGRIEDTIKTLNELTAERDQLTAEVTQAQQDRNNVLSTFEATCAKITSTLEEERKRIQVYLPQVMSNGK